MFKKRLIIIVLVGCICSFIFAKEAAYIGTYQVGEATYEEVLKQIIAEDGLMPGCSYQETLDLMKSILTYPMFLDQIDSSTMNITITKNHVSISDSDNVLPYSIDSQRNLIVHTPDGRSIKLGTFTKDYSFLDLRDNGFATSMVIRLEKQKKKSE